MKWKAGHPHESKGKSERIGKKHIDIYPTNEADKRTAPHHKDIKISYDSEKPQVGDITKINFPHTVVDSKTSAPIPSATITMINQTTGAEHIAVTDSSGRCTFYGLTPGLYLRKFEAAGYIARQYYLPLGSQQADTNIIEKSENAISVRALSSEGRVQVQHASKHKVDHRISHKVDHRENNRKR
jgi:hypothetical protein